MKKITYVEAINEALHQEMERDKNIICCGIGIQDHKAIFGSTKGLLEKFGKNRIIESNLAEDSVTGFCIGAAMNGLRPIYVHARADFSLLAMNQIINMMSAVEYMSNGQLKCPIVIRIIIGRGFGQGFQHSKSLFSLFTHIPGLKVIAPSNPRDMKGMLIKAIRDDSPVICFEHRWLYCQEQEVDEGSYETPFTPLLYHNSYGNSTDMCLLSYSWGVIECMRASDILWKKYGLSVDVLDLRLLSDLDIGCIVKYIHCKECIIVEDDWLSNSVGAGFLAKYIDCGYPSSYNYISFSRIGWKNTPCPTARHLEDDFYYNVKDIILKVVNKLGLQSPDLSDVDCYSYENKSF